MSLFLATGTFSLCFPERYLTFGVRRICEEPDAVTWTDGVVPAVRVLGALHVLLGLRAAVRRRILD